MKVSYSYRGVKTELKTKFESPRYTGKGFVLVKSGWGDSREKLFTVAIEPHELLNTARECLLALNLIAGTNYKVTSYV